MPSLNFDATQYTPSQFTDPLPAGKYTVAITASDRKKTKNKSGEYLEFEYTVLDGEHKNRKTWDRLCIEHASPEAQRIARERLANICHAVGNLAPKTTEQIHNIPFMIKVKVKHDPERDEYYNEVKGYGKLERKPEPTPKPQTSQAPQNDDSAPWG